MKFLISTPVLQHLALFAPHLNGPLATVANQIPVRPLRSNLRLPAAMNASFAPDFTLSPTLNALPGVKALSPAQRLLLGRAASQLQLLDIEVEAVYPLHYGLRLHLHRELQVGQVVVYHKKNGAWSAVEPQGPWATLTNTARRQLRAPLPTIEANAVKVLPHDIPLHLVAAFCQLGELATQLGWSIPASRLGATGLSMWLHDGHGLVLVRLNHGANAALVSGEVYRAYAQAAANTAHDLLRQLVGVNSFSA